MPDSVLANLTKYVFRVLHIGPMVFLSYKIILDYFNDSLSTQNTAFFAVMGVLTAFAGKFFSISGVVNMFLLKPKKMGDKKKLWMSWHHIKFIITIVLFSPVYKYLLQDGDLVKVRFYFMCSCLLVSPFMRFYREYYVAENK
jgi:hypothetical protein